MRVAAISGAVIAALAAGAVATPSYSQTYDYRGDDACRHKQHNSGTTGAVVGGIAGAVVGSNLTHHHGARAGGAVLGGLAGAAIGNSIGRSSAKSSSACRGYTYYNGRYYDNSRYYDGRYYDGRYGYNYNYPYSYNYDYDNQPRPYDPYY